MDNPAMESTPLDTNQAGALFAEMLEPKTPEAEQKEPEAKEDPAKAEEPAPNEAEEGADAEPAKDDDPTVTIKIDGKDVEVKLSELKNGYQRQADYTRKTMETAEQRKAAEAESNKARQERAEYGQKLQNFEAQLVMALQAQNSQEWTPQAIEADPVGYLKHQALAQTRQAQLMQVQQERQKVMEAEEADRKQAHESHVQREQQELLAKLPDWKDATKAKAEKAAIAAYLTEKAGFDQSALQNITDHRAVLLARKAMLYDQMVEKAQTAAKKVATLPTKVERPGVSETQGVDKRSAVYQRAMKTGKVEDMGALFASIL